MLCVCVFILTYNSFLQCFWFFLSPSSLFQSTFTTVYTSWTATLTNQTNTAVQSYLNTNAGVSTITCSSAASATTSRRRRNLLTAGQTAVATAATIPAGTSAASLAKAKTALAFTSSIASAIASATGLTPTVTVSSPTTASSSASGLFAPVAGLLLAVFAALF